MMQLEGDLMKLIPEWESQFGQAFMVNGSRLLEDLSAKVESEQAARPPSRVRSFLVKFMLQSLIVPMSLNALASKNTCSVGWQLETAGSSESKRQTNYAASTLKLYQILRRNHHRQKAASRMLYGLSFDKWTTCG